MECNRHKDIDILKGIGIILVVLGHSGFPYIYCNFFYQFHMAIFFMASGYCWNKKNSASIVTCKKYIFRKFKTLYLPYVVYNGIFLLLNNVLIKLGIYTTNSDFLILAACTNGGKYDWGIGEHMKIAHLIKEFIKVIFFGGKTQLGGALWFLRALFVITVGHCIYEYYIIKINSKLRIVLIGMLCLLCYIVYELYANGIIKGRYMHIVISMTLAYMVYIIGMLFRYLEEKKLFEVNIWIAITAMLLLTKCTSFGKISIGDAYVTNIPYFLTVSVCGWYLTIWISRILSAWHGGGDGLFGETYHADYSASLFVF